MKTFRLLRPFNDPETTAYAGSSTRIGRNTAAHFPGDSQTDRLVRALAAERKLPIKEVTEAFEFFATTRRHFRGVTTIVDLCAGHGLAGILFGVFERHVERVILCDKRRPEHQGTVLAAAVRVAPWVEAKVEYREDTLASLETDLPKGAGVIGVHACGRLTDECLRIATGLGGPVAVMPCCRPIAINPAPRGLRAALGEDVAFDVDRTYTMERRGYDVRWRTIPESITPMNRVLVATPVRSANPDARAGAAR